MTTLLDNRTHGKVGEVLAESMEPNCRLSVLSCLFSVYAYASMKKELERIGVLRLLIPSKMPVSDEDDNHSFAALGLAGNKEDRRFRNNLNIVQIARECAEWIKHKAQVKSVSRPVPQNLYHIENSDGTATAIHGSSPFTTSGLGFTPSNSYEMNTCFTTSGETESLLEWFDTIWADDQTCAHSHHPAL